MNRNEVLRGMSAHGALTCDQAGAALDALGQVLRDAAHRGEKVQLAGLLTMEVVERAARNGRNPRTGEAMTVPATTSVRLSAGSPIKAAARAGAGELVGAR